MAIIARTETVKAKGRRMALKAGGWAETGTQKKKNN